MVALREQAELKAGFNSKMSSSSTVPAQKAIDAIHSRWVPLFYGAEEEEEGGRKEVKKQEKVSVTYENCAIYAIGFWNSNSETMRIVYVTLAQDPSQALIRIRNGGKGGDKEEAHLIQSLSNCVLAQRRCYYFSALDQGERCTVSDILDQLPYKTDFNTEYDAYNSSGCIIL